ncbi:MAG: PepSY1/2 domain-containing protein, partial [Acutalibacteraceae bacterium]
YEFRCTTEDGLAIDVSVTKKDGLMYQALPNTAGDELIRPTEQELKVLESLAAQYLQQRGFPEMKGAYAQYYNGMAVLNMLPVENEVYLYPDLVKVWMEVKTGRIVGMDANNYIVYHTQRQKTQSPAVLDQQAIEQRIAQRLDIQACRLALIPTDDGQEVLCYEFVGTNQGDAFYIHINAETGAEEDILQIVDAEDGTFVY